MAKLLARENLELARFASKEVNRYSLQAILVSPRFVVLWSDAKTHGHRQDSPPVQPLTDHEEQCERETRREHRGPGKRREDADPLSQPSHHRDLDRPR